MKRWFAVGEPLVSVTVRFPMIRRKDKAERLWDRAVAYAARGSSPEDYYDWKSHISFRVSVLLAERNAVLRVLDGRRGWGNSAPIPRWKWRKRKKLTTALCEGHRIAKWW